MESAKPEDKYRLELKYSSDVLTSSEISDYIRVHPNLFIKAHPNRYINNIYFDSSRLISYFDNLDGNMDRFKCRVRWYGKDEFSGSQLEFKIKHGQMGKKEILFLEGLKINDYLSSKNIDIILSAIKNPKFLEIMSNLSPVLINSYKRKYFVTADQKVRLTVDSEIQYSSTEGGYIVKDTTPAVVELKAHKKHLDTLSHVARRLPFRQTRFSKYMNGLTLLR